MPTTSCPLCSEQASVIYQGHPGYQEPDVFDIARCNTCQTSFVLADGIDVSPIYEAIYRQASVIPGYGRYAVYAREILKSEDPLGYLADQEVIYWGVRRRLEQLGKRNIRILEIGSGLGYLTYALNKAGYHTTGIDISSSAIEKAISTYGAGHYLQADLFAYAQANIEQYDVVILTEVIEHLSDPYPFLRAGLSLLAPGGELLITTPNNAAYASDVVWEVEGPPVHLWWLSTHSFTAMANKIGCSLNFLDLSDFPAADTWYVEQIPGSPCVSKFPILDRNGLSLTEARGVKGVVKKALGSLGLLSKIQAVRADAREKRRTEARAGQTGGPSPTIFAILQNEPTSATTT